MQRRTFLKTAAMAPQAQDSEGRFISRRRDSQTNGSLAHNKVFRFDVLFWTLRMQVPTVVWMCNRSSVLTFLARYATGLTSGVERRRS